MSHLQLLWLECNSSRADNTVVFRNMSYFENDEGVLFASVCIQNKGFRESDLFAFSDYV